MTGLDPRSDPYRDEDAQDYLAAAMPDLDRRDGALERLLARVLGDRAWQNRRSTGGVARRRAQHRLARPDAELLTARQKEALTCASHGLGIIETADVMGVDPQTVRHHRKRAQRLLRAKNLEHAVAQAIRRGVIR